MVRLPTVLAVLIIAPQAVADGDTMEMGTNVIAGGLHYEHPGRWAGLRVFGAAANGGYLTFDMQIAPWFYDEPELPDGWWARNVEVHMAMPFINLGGMHIAGGVGFGVSELSLNRNGVPRPESSSEDEKAGFFGPELGIGMSTPFGGFALAGVAHLTKDAQIRHGVDFHSIIGLGKVLAIYSTIGWARLEVNERMTSGFSVLVGFSPTFLYAK